MKGGYVVAFREGKCMLHSTDKRYGISKNLRRRRNLSCLATPELPPCMEEPVACATVDACTSYVPPTQNIPPRPPSTDSAVVLPIFPSVLTPPPQSISVASHRLNMPPGPPTSPVPSPPPVTRDLLPDIPNEGSSTITEDDELPTMGPSPLLTTAHSEVFKNRLRRRRHAICANSALGQGLREFFVSYTISHLADSMTSSLNLDLQPSVFLNEHNGTSAPCIDQSEFLE